LLSILFRFLLNFFCSDASSSSEPFISNLWSSVLFIIWRKSKLGQHYPSFGKHCWSHSRSLLSKGKLITQIIQLFISSYYHLRF
jgi:hypothetical protein